MAYQTNKRTRFGHLCWETSKMAARLPIITDQILLLNEGILFAAGTHSWLHLGSLEDAARQLIIALGTTVMRDSYITIGIALVFRRLKQHVPKRGAQQPRL